jgi:hypothetical protein
MEDTNHHEPLSSISDFSDPEWNDGKRKAKFPKERWIQLGVLVILALLALALYMARESL